MIIYDYIFQIISGPIKQELIWVQSYLHGGSQYYPSSIILDFVSQVMDKMLRSHYVVQSWVNITNMLYNNPVYPHFSITYCCIFFFFFDKKLDQVILLVVTWKLFANYGHIVFQLCKPISFVYIFDNNLTKGFGKLTFVLAAE